MMKRFSHLFILLFAVAIIQSCGILGVHINVHNPKKAGKYPKFKEETILLGQLDANRSKYDVVYYDISIEVIPKKKRLQGEVQMTANVLSNLDTIQMDLQAHFDINQIVDLKSNQKLNYYRQENVLYIPQKLKKGETIHLAIQYAGKPKKAKKAPWKGGFVWKKDKDKNDWIGVACQTEGASIWWPLKDHTSDEPDSVRMHYTVPNHLKAIGNGRFEGISNKTETTQTYNWHVSYPINTYNITLYVGRFQLIQDQYKRISGDSVLLSYYVLPQDFNKAKDHFKQVHKILGSFESLFGAYPWPRDGYKLIQSPYEGMEHQTAIAYGNGFKNDLGETDYILLHETAHEWWGNSVTSEDLADVWLQEGFATYAESLYLEEQNIEDPSYNYHLWLNKIFIQNKYPLVGPREKRYFHFRKSSDAYVKGAWVLHSLRTQMNHDSLFFDVIQSFYKRSQYQMVTSQDFISIVNEKTETDYSWLFAQYLYNNEVPELSFTIKNNGQLIYKWNNVPDNFNKMKIFIVSNKETIELTPSTQTQILQLTANKEELFAFHFLNKSLYALKEDKKLH